MIEIEATLDALDAQGRRRQLTPITLRRKGTITVEGKTYWDMSSNDYLGLAQEPKLKESAQRVLQEYGMGATGSRLLTGDYTIFHKLESAVAKFKKKPAALIFNSGYQANVGLVSALVGRQDVVFADRYIHASMLDGVKLSGAKLIRFHHNDARHLQALLRARRSEYRNALILTESVFSMDGDVAPLKELIALKSHFDAQLIVDEAHATGVFGESGSGLVEAEDLSQDVDFIVGTFSKALGGFGAYIATSESCKSYLINCCRSFIYSTALPLPVIAWNLASIEFVRTESRRRRRLIEKVKRLRAQLENSRLPLLGSTQIIPILIPETHDCLNAAETLRANGFWVSAVRPPTVPANSSRIRLTVTYHQPEKSFEDLMACITS